MKKTILAACLLYSASGFAGGIPVYSAVEHSQQILSHIEVLNDASVQLEKLGVMDQQLTTQLQSLVTQYEQLDLQIQNARRLYGDLAYLEDADLKDIIKEVQYVASKMELLDPTNPHYDEVAKETVWDEYGDPTIRASDRLSGNSVAIERLDGEGERIQQGYEDYLRYQKYRSAQNMLAANRAKTINQYGYQLDNLGDNSSLATQQLTAAQINFLLTQQEELINSVSELNQREERREQEQRALEREAYQDKIDTLYRRANTLYRAGGEQ